MFAAIDAGGKIPHRGGRRKATGRYSLRVDVGKPGSAMAQDTTRPAPTAQVRTLHGDKETTGPNAGLDL
jgi:hypothetical protein